MSGLFAVPITSVTQLTSEQLVHVMRAVLRSECRYAKLSPSSLTISNRLTIADGGIDAEISTNSEYSVPTDCLFPSGLSGIQIKSGTSFKPWTNSSIKGELLNSADNLYPEVARLAERRGRYILVCSGHDLTPEQRNDAKENIKNFLESKGHLNYGDLIDVIGASQLAEFIERYPGIVSMVTSDPVEEAWVLEEWQQDAHMNNIFAPSEEQLRVIQHIREGIILRESKHIRILGEPGIGKTRLVLEALKDPDIAPYVLYIAHGLDFAKTAIFRRLLRATYDKPLVLVIDELPEYELSEIWNSLKRRCGLLKIVSIDHGHDETRDEDIERIQAPRLTDDAIKQILVNCIGESRALDRWATICDGSPRVAQAVAENLRANPEDLFKPPSTVPLWARFIHGYRHADKISTRQIDCVTQHLALFNRFGFESPVHDEAVYIAKMIESVDSTIGWARFQEIVQDLRSRRVLQGRHTLFFVPRALHLYLWLQFWKSYGRGFDFATTFKEMPESLQVWFMSMFKYADDTARRVIEDTINPTGIYADSSFLTSAKGSRFLSILAEASPSGVMRLLEATIGTWSDADLLAFQEHRQNIVWTLEKIAVWTPFTVRAMKLLTRLAANENSKFSNNATGTLLALFKIGPEWAATESSPENRLPAMLELLSSSSDTIKMLALKAMESALDTRGFGSRIVGPEYQGLKDRAKLWMPATYGDLWNACFLYFSTLVNETQSWSEHLRPQVCEALLNAVERLIDIPPCTELAFDVLKILLNDNKMSASKLNHFFWFRQEYKDEDHLPEISNRLKALERYSTQKSLATRFQRYVIDVEYAEWDEDFREGTNKPTNRVKQLVNAFAKRIGEHPEKFTEIQHLIAPNSNKYTQALWYFSEQLGNYDANQSLLPTLIQIALETKYQGCLHAYLSTVKTNNPDLYTQTLTKLLEEKESAWLGASIALGSSCDGALFDFCLLALEKQWIESWPFRRLCFGNAYKEIPSTQINHLFRIFFTRGDQSSLSFIIDLLAAIPFDTNAPFTSDFVFESIVRSTVEEADQHPIEDYRWKEVCEKLICWNNEYAMPLFNVLLRKIEESHRLTYDSYVDPLAKELIRMSPMGAWEIIRTHLDSSPPDSWYHLLNWLGGGLSVFQNRKVTPIFALLPINEILQWIDIKPEERAKRVAHFVPKTLSDEDGGQLTREILCRYSHDQGVLSGVSARFHTGGWQGPTSLYLRGKRESFREWLTMGFQYEVTLWIESELEYLNRKIELEEINEERSNFE